MTDAAFPPSSAPVSTQTPVLPPVDEEKNKLWSEYVNKGFELGALHYNKELQERNLRMIDKKLEVAHAAVVKAGDKHDEYVKSKANPASSPTKEPANENK